MSMLDHQTGEAGYETPRLLSIRCSCRILGISRTSLYALMASGQLRSVTIGRRRFVPSDAIDEFITALPTAYRRVP
jgi:excisionase family DNA binding protein